MFDGDELAKMSVPKCHQTLHTFTQGRLVQAHAKRGYSKEKPLWCRKDLQRLPKQAFSMHIDLMPGRADQLFDL